MLDIVGTFASALENELTPSLSEGVGLADDLQDLRFKLFLGSRERVEKVVSDGTLGKKCLQRDLVFTERKDALNVGHCATEQGGLE